MEQVTYIVASKELEMRIVAPSPIEAAVCFRLLTYTPASESVIATVAPPQPHVSTLYRETHNRVEAPAYRNLHY